MIKDLNLIFEAITPENIRNVPIIRDAINIFIELLEEYSSESIDIRNIFNNTSVKEELIKIYLDDLYHVLQTINYNKQVIDKINETNEFYGTEYYKTNVIFDLKDFLTEEHFLSFKSFKQNKGTEKAINYIYDLINVFITPTEEALPFELIDNSPFNLEIRTSVPEEFYQHIVRPLAHPLGFLYEYYLYVQLILQDYFPEEKFSYNIRTLEIRCLQEDGNTTVTDFQYYTDLGGNTVERVVVDLITTFEGTNRVKIIEFDDGTYLKQTTTSAGQTLVVYYDSDDSVLQNFTGQCSIYFDYTFSFATSVTDDILFKDSKEIIPEIYSIYPKLPKIGMEYPDIYEPFKYGSFFEKNDDGSFSPMEYEFLSIGDPAFFINHLLFTQSEHYNDGDAGTAGVMDFLSTKIIPSEATQTHQEYSFETSLNTIGSYDKMQYIGDPGLYIRYTIQDVETIGDSYFNVGEFDVLSDDTEDWTFNVIRNGIVLEDNNYSVLP